MNTDPSPTERKKILFVVNDHGSFIDTDFSILQKHFDVQKLELFHRPFLTTFRNFKSLSKTDMIFIWFGSLDFLPLLIIAKLLNKKVFIVTGGFDVAKAELIQHGAFTQSKPRQILRRLLFRLITKAFAVSEFNAAEAKMNAKIPPHKIRVIPLGFEPMHIPLKHWNSRKNQVVMISSLTKKSFVNKGGPHLIEIAKKLPEFDFVLMGSLSDEVKENFLQQCPRNLRCTGFLPYRSAEFFEILQDSKIILQLSYYESFCAALIDGTMMGAFPLAWNRAALPETLKGLGEIAEYGDFDSLAVKIRGVMTTEYDVEDLAETAREKYPLEKREKALMAELSKDLSASQQ